MLKYCYIGDRGVLTVRTPQPVHGKLTVDLPRGGTLYVNGHACNAPTGHAFVPVSRLAAVNTVRVRDDFGTYRCEGFSWDGASVIPAGFDGAETVALLCVALSDTRERLARAEQTLREWKQLREAPLFG